VTSRFYAWGKFAQKIRVPAGTVLGLVFLYFMHPSPRSLWLGCTVALAGGLLRLWAAGHIDKQRVLARSGPYALTRNPLYLGSFLMGTGILVAGQGYWLLIPFGLLFAALYFPVMRAEEQELFQGHGADFEDYARTVPLFFPTLKPHGDATSKFLWSRVLRNREHRTLAVLLLTEAYLTFRGFR
jgi:protein-S-isoprenylcysteine O-methyltransferase Ste14